MKNERPEYSLVHKGLLVRKVGDEVIIYNHRDQRAHCLNEISSSVWHLWEAGRSVHDICLELEQQDESLVLHILSELSKSGLPMKNKPPTDHEDMMSRRELVKRLGTRMALAIPFVTSIVVPMPSSAVTPAAHRFRRRT